MENQVAVYSFRGRGVRTVKDENGDLWFVAKDVAERLGVLWNGATSIAHVPEEWRGVLTVNTPSGRQSAITLSEQGLYFFLGRSDKPQALPFQKWIAGEVLPPNPEDGGIQQDPSDISRGIGRACRQDEAAPDSRREGAGRRSEGRIL